MDLTNFATEVAGSNVSSWLLLWVLKGSLLLALLFPLSALLRRSASSTRHLIWTAGLAIVVLLPVLSALLPWRVELPQMLSAMITQDVSDAGVSLPQSRESAPPENATFAPAQQDTRNPSNATTSSNEITSPGPITPVTTPRWTRARVINALLFAWLAGAALLLARIALSRRRVRQLVAGGTPLTELSWTRPLMEVADRLDLPELPRLVVNADAAMPLTCGITRPAIVLPPEAAQWTDERRRAVLCHELAHVRRRDLISHLLGRVACALYWFQPLAWSAARRMRAESERACDDLVLITGTRASTYADHLLQIVTSVRRVSAPIVALPMAQPREFEARLLSILEPGRKRQPLPKLQAASLLALVFAIALPLVALSPAPAPGQSPLAADAASNDEAAEQQDERAGAPAPNAAPSADTDANPQGNQQPQQTQQQQRVNTQQLTNVITNIATNAANAALGMVLGQQQSQDPRVRAALIRALGDSVADVARSAAWALASHRDTAVVRALSAAARSARDASVREMATWAIVQQGRLSAASLQLLSTALTSDRDPEVRETAAWGLGHGDAASVTALERALRTDSASEVRMTAAWALGQHGATSSVPALTEALSFRDHDVRQLAAWALGHIQLQTAPASLIAAVRDSVAEVRVVAAWSLGNIADPASASALRNALTDTDTEVRRAAIWAIAMLKGDVAIDALTTALTDKDAEVRAAAAAALGGHGPQVWPWPWPWPRPRPSP